MKEILQRRKVNPARGARESRASQRIAKAMEGVKALEAQPRRTLRRRGNGMLSQCSEQQGRSHLVVGTTARVSFGISWKMKSVAMPGEKSEGAVVPWMARQDKRAGGKGPCFNPVQRGGK